MKDKTKNKANLLIKLNFSLFTMALIGALFVEHAKANNICNPSLDTDALKDPKDPKDLEYSNKFMQELCLRYYKPEYATGRYKQYKNFHAMVNSFVSKPWIATLGRPSSQ